eukprot:jgi/Mesen1/5096/ME000252S04207
MKAKTLQILWHGKDPILSLDFDRAGLLATGGADKDIKLWKLTGDEDGTPVVTFQASLSHHHYAVNVVRFSPTGGELLLWKLIHVEGSPSIWKVVRTLSRHEKDVLDLGWSADGTQLVSGSVDNTCIVWDITKGSVLAYLTEHKHYVQGVACDPLGQYLATISADRTCCIYTRSSCKGKGRTSKELYSCHHTLCKRHAAASSSSLAPAAGAPPPGAGGAAGAAGAGGAAGEAAAAAAAAAAGAGGDPAAGAAAVREADAHGAADASAANKELPQKIKYNMFHDENIPSFFRRLSWSPDGSFIIVPAGLYKKTAEAAAQNVSFIFSRKNLTSPVMSIPSAGKPAVAVRFCPAFFSSSNSMPPGAPSKLLNVSSVFVYDTRQAQPLAVLAGLHYAPITDLAWSPDGHTLAISSQDGYCTLASFQAGELGTTLQPSELPAHVARLLPEMQAVTLGALQMHPAGSSDSLQVVTPAPTAGPSVAASVTPVVDVGRAPGRPQRITPVAITDGQMSSQRSAPVASPAGLERLQQADTGCKEAAESAGAQSPPLVPAVLFQAKEGCSEHSSVDGEPSSNCCPQTPSGGGGGERSLPSNNFGGAATKNDFTGLSSKGGGERETDGSSSGPQKHRRGDKNADLYVRPIKIIKRITPAAVDSWHSTTIA